MVLNGAAARSDCFWPKADTRTLVTERPLSVKADIRQQAGGVLHINGLFQVILPPLPNKEWTPKCGAFFRFG